MNTMKTKTAQTAKTLTMKVEQFEALNDNLTYRNPDHDLDPCFGNPAVNGMKTVEVPAHLVVITRNMIARMMDNGANMGKAFAQLV